MTRGVLLDRDGFPAAFARYAGNPVPPTPVDVVFESDWGTALGRSQAALGDGGKWPLIYGFPGNTEFTLESVLASTLPVPFSRKPNVLQITQAGSTRNGTLEAAGVLPLNSDTYGQFFVINRGNTSVHNHPLQYNVVGGFQAIPFGLIATDLSWNPFIRTEYNQDGGGQTFPYLQWSPGVRTVPGASQLDHDVMYRYRWHVEIVATAPVTRYRIYPEIRTYDDTVPNDPGTVLFDYTTFFRQNHTEGQGTFPYISLADYYDAGLSFGFQNPLLARNLGLGQEGSAGAVDTGNSWYVGDFQIFSNGWRD